MTELEEIFLAHRPEYCRECGGKMIFQGAGTYLCANCGYEDMDDYGRIRDYLEKHEGANALEIAEGTGVELEIIRMFLKDGRIQIPDGSKLFITCQRCGCSLRHGRYCADCTREMAGGIRSALYESMGEKPREAKKINSHKMRYF